MGRVVLNEVFNTRLNLLEDAVAEPGVLATVAGTFAEPTKRNKNGRLYGLEPWKVALSDEDVVRSLERKIMFGELDHPEDYLSVKIDKTAICVTKLDINEANGTIDGELKVLDTPAGQLLNTLIRFGSILGVSSRASGELDKNNNVIPETFKFITFDIVTNPSNAGAIPHLVESVEENVKDLSDILLEAIGNADLSQLKIIKDMSSSLSEEKAALIINKVDERKASLLKEDVGSSEEKIEVLTSEVSEMKDLLLRLTDLFYKAFPELTDVEPETSVESEEVETVVESVVKAHPRKLLLKESAKDTTISSATIVEGVETKGNTGRRVEHLVNTNKSK